MRRYLIPVAVILLMVAPAVAQNAASGTGRYQIAPGPEGFTRLDTRTGSLSHCTERDGVWRCEPLGDQSGLDQKLDDLSGKVGQLSTDLNALNARVDSLATRFDALAARPDAEPAPPADQSGFVEKAVRRLFDMVRAVKHAQVGSVCPAAMASFTLVLLSFNACNSRFCSVTS